MHMHLCMQASAHVRSEDDRVCVRGDGCARCQEAANADSESQTGSDVVGVCWTSFSTCTRLSCRRACISSHSGSFLAIQASDLQRLAKVT